MPEEVKNQIVELETPLEELNLPDKLTAICVPVGIEGHEEIESLDKFNVFSEVKGLDLESEISYNEVQEVSENPEEMVVIENIT